MQFSWWLENPRLNHVTQSWQYHARLLAENAIVKVPYNCITYFAKESIFFTSTLRHGTEMFLNINMKPRESTSKQPCIVTP